ncbi:MAG TPA: P-type conjugative transfer protein TrbL, partial [Acetobacteraceae bacterium]|nr:P-type conjugative transfer protein TrbL [Acetobacteraceae bacterium]
PGSPAMAFNRRSSIFATLIPLAVIAGPAPAHAAGLLDTVTGTFQFLQHSWFSALVGDAKELFTLLAGLEIAFLAVTWMLARRTFDEVLPSLLKKIITISFFYAILINAGSWVPDVINGFVGAGQTASAMASLTPSTLMDYGIQDCYNILTGAGATSGSGGSTGFFGKALGVAEFFAKGGGVALIIEYVERFFIAILLFVAFLYIAIEMAVLLIESYMILGAGVLFLGFGGSRWTTKFVDGYLNYSVSVGVKLFVIYLIVGALVKTVIPDVNNMLAGIANPTAGTFDLANGLTAAAVMVVAAMLVKKVPEKAGSLLTGSSFSSAASFGSEATRAAMTVGAVAAGAVTAGAAAAPAIAAASTGATAAIGGGAAGMSGASMASVGVGAGGAAAASGGGVAASGGAAGVAAPSFVGSASGFAGGGASGGMAGLSGGATAGQGAAVGAPASASSGGGGASVSAPSSVPGSSNGSGNSATSGYQGSTGSTDTASPSGAGGSSGGSGSSARPAGSSSAPSGTATSPGGAQPSQSAGPQQKPQGAPAPKTVSERARQAMQMMRAVGQHVDAHLASGSGAAVNASHVNTSHGHDG